MITLPNTKYGTRRRAIIGGISFNVIHPIMHISFYVELIDAQGNLLEDLSLNQGRVINHSFDNSKNVDAQFNIVESGGTPEYAFFFEKMKTIPLPTLILQLAEKLKTRGIFE